MNAQMKQHRGDVDVDTEFFKIYDKEAEIKRVLPALEPLTKDDFVLKEEVPYVLSSLKEFFENNTIKIEEVDEEELLGEEIPALKVKEVKDQNNDKVHF